LFTNLGAGNYEFQLTDVNGCMFTELVTVLETNNVTANFIATPENGLAPLEVDFDNTSTGANNYEWEIVNSSSGIILSQSSGLSTEYSFETSGTYQTCLIVYNNIPTCTDTVCKTIIVGDGLSFIIPNIFTPNRDDNNDLFMIKVEGISLLK
tara:strand:+ start:1985 stop:2440 length:456 start_codon:yes stop_codon:yes gene_type:complete